MFRQINRDKIIFNEASPQQAAGYQEEHLIIIGTDLRNPQLALMI
jgi:hypothetical protein